MLEVSRHDADRGNPQQLYDRTLSYHVHWEYHLKYNRNVVTAVCALSVDPPVGLTIWLKSLFRLPGSIGRSLDVHLYLLCTVAGTSR